jgi:hypothetical protein
MVTLIPIAIASATFDAAFDVGNVCSRAQPLGEHDLEQTFGLNSLSHFSVRVDCGLAKFGGVGFATGNH